MTMFLSRLFTRRKVVLAGAAPHDPGFWSKLGHFLDDTTHWHHTRREMAAQILSLSHENEMMKKALHSIAYLDKDYGVTTAKEMARDALKRIK